MWSRIYLIPMLTAEEDRDLVRRHLADQNREKELLGKTTSAYNSDRYDAQRLIIHLLGLELTSIADLCDLHSQRRRREFRNKGMDRWRGQLNSVYM
jgi:hypothetical protein